MKNPELMMYRAAIGQILADSGINRETIKDMVRKSIDEKVDRQVPSIVQNKVANIQNTIEFRKTLKAAIRDEVERAVSNLDIIVNMPITTYTDNELIRECARRGFDIKL